MIGLGLRDALMHAAPTLPPQRYGELAQRYRTHYLARQHDLVPLPRGAETALVSCVMIDATPVGAGATHK